MKGEKPNKTICNVPYNYIKKASLCNDKENIWNYEECNINIAITA